MKIRVAGVEITKWQNLSVTLCFDSIKSIFSVDFYWDPWDKAMRLVMLPGGYNQVTIISDNGEVLLTGIFINPSFKSGSKPSLVNMSGYSLTGVLDDVEYSALFSTAQVNGKTFYEICSLVCAQMGLQVVDNTGGQASKTIVTTSSTQAESTIERSDPDRQQTVADYLSDLARGLNIVLSHDVYGNLVLNYNLGLGDALYNFSQGMPGVEYSLSVDGSQMHSLITAATQSDYNGSITQTKTVENPFVAPQGNYNYRTSAINNANILNSSYKILNKGKFIADAGIILTPLQILREFNIGYRPHSVTQTDTDAPNLQDVANQALADELTAIVLTIDIDRWELNSKLVLPGNIVSVQNPELYLFNKANFFIKSATFTGDESQTGVKYVCTVPEAYNGVVPTKSIFFGTNYTNFVQENPPIRSDDRKGVFNNLGTPPNL